ncbi:MAG: hypothetical protein GY787_24865 [Alteromonadales bacterium]|nr:hypothetical protein [Alteromonadales bacterium]
MSVEKNAVESAMNLKGDYFGNYYQRFLDADNADAGDRQRALSNLRLYMPTTAWDMFPGEIRQQFTEQSRRPSKYNLIPNYVEGHAGMLTSANSVDPEFIDSESDDVDVSQTLKALKRVYLADKNIFHYEQSHNASVLNGCIYRGVEEITINRNFMDPLGRPSFKSLSPTSVIFDPTAVQTDDIGAESKEAWKRFYLYPGEIKNLFPDSAEAVRGYLASQSNFSEAQSFVNVPEELYWQNKYMVVEWYHSITEKVEIAYDSESMIPLPNSPSHKFGSEEDFNFKKQWSESQGRQLNPSAITVREKKEDALYVTTFAPGLSAVLQNKRDERQIKRTDGSARLPFYVWAFSQKNGKTTGVVDTIRDAQEDINKREAARTKFITQTPQQKMVVHPDAYGDDQAKRDELTNNLNDPSTPFFLDEGAPPGVPLITNINGVQVPQAFFQDEQFKINLMDRMSAFNQSMQGLEGKSGESGILFARKVVEGNTINKVRAGRLQEYQMDKFEGWFQLAKKLYGGDTSDEKLVNMNRTFVESDGKKVVLNKIEGYDAFNQPIVVNDLSKLRRVHVIINEVKQSAYEKQISREVNVSLSNVLGPNTPYKAVLDAELVKSVDNMTPENKELIDDISTLSIEATKKTLELQIAQTTMQIQQIKGGGQQQGVPGQPQGQGGMEMPPELLNAQATQDVGAQVA